ncbi:MAG: transporter substrate-binding domain-containing protein [Prevotella sp.]|nr:transporter substrate-binding domain-containing protein [Prevotella sp.]
MKRCMHPFGLIIALLLCVPALSHTYTAERPLVYEDAWDLWPYSFVSDANEELGYNLDLLRLVMDELNIPYVVRLKPRSEVLADLKAGRADLTMGMAADFHNEFGSYGQRVIQLFTHSVVWPKGEPQLFKKEADLKDRRVMVHKGSFSHHLMEDNGWGGNALPIGDMKEAIIRLDQEGGGHMIWNTASLKWLMRNYQLENLQIAPVQMSDGVYKFMSNDTVLLAKIDQAISRLGAEDRLADIQNYWFYPETMGPVIPSWLWYCLNMAVVLAVLLLVVVVWVYFAERRAKERCRKRTSRLSLVLNASGLSIWLFNVAERKFTWIDKQGKIGQQYPYSAMTTRVGHENLSRITDCLDQIENGIRETARVEVETFAESNPTGGNRIYVIDFSVLRRDKGKPTMIIAVCTDVYEERHRQKQAISQLNQYRSVFNTALVDMLYFDDHLRIVDMNERAQNTINLSLQEAREKKMTLNDIVEMEAFDSSSPESYYATKFLTKNGRLTDVKAEDARVYEMQVLPILDANGKLQCVYGTGIGITELMTTYRALQASIKHVQQATKEVTEYVENINYVMGVGGVRMASYSPDSHTLTLFKSLDVVQHQLTQTRCMSFVADASKKEALRMLNNMDNRKNMTINANLWTTLRVNAMQLCLQVNFVPVTDESGRVTAYFGMCRDQSEMANTELLLKKETERAQEVEDLKNSFLRNMSYEIRTPLNAVVGFAEMFEMEHSQEDEELFIQEIKQNSSHLLHLINDILFLSRLDAHMIEMEIQSVDFAQTFDAHCQLGWANDMKDGVRYVVEIPFEKLQIDIDDVNIGRVIEQLTANAAQHTEQGMVHTRCDYMNGKLVIAIEDTGCGIKPELMDRVFERFASAGSQGTGLGLPICKELVAQMNGTLDLSSEVGKGTIVWVTIPAVATVVERKKSI